MRLHARLARFGLRALGFDAVRRGSDLLLMRRDRPEAEQHRGFRDALVHEHVAGVLRELRISCVLDVGANEGQYALELRRAGYEGEIVSFEPVPDTLETLRGRAEGDPRWRVHPYALGSEDTSAEIHVSNATVYSSFLASNAYGRKRVPDSIGVARREKVAIRRLDSVFDEVTSHVPDRRCFLKTDTQGFDLEVFRGAGDRIGEIQGLQSEIAAIPIYQGVPPMAEVLATYERCGFGLTGLFPVARERDSARVIEFDCVMMRA